MPSLLAKINQEKLAAFRDYLVAKGHSPKSIQRKESSLRKFLAWATAQGYIEAAPDTGYQTSGTPRINPFGKLRINTERGQSIKNYKLKIKNLRSGLPTYVTYFNLVFIILVSAALAFGAYRQFFAQTQKPLAYPNAPVAPNRVLSFQGRLTDTGDTPIATATNVVFKLYDSAGTGNPPTGGNVLWNSGTCSISPDQDGIFSTILGSDCGGAIASSVFTENNGVWLGVTVATDNEAYPRIQIATVAYALNSETLQGFPVGSATNATPEATMGATARTIPALNSYGNLVIAAASPTIWSTSGTFGIKGQAISMTTATGTNGNITLAPDGQGVLNLTLSATTGKVVNATDANLGSAGGKEDNALYYGLAANDLTNYNLLKLESGSTPTAKFTVDSAGNASMAGTLKVLSTAAGAFDVAGGIYAGTNDAFQVSTGGNISGVNLNLTGYATASASLAIGYSSVLAGVGNAVFQGNVGIGTSNPAYKLQVSGGNVYFEEATYLGTTSTYFDTNGNLSLGNYATISGTLSLAPQTQAFAGTCNAGTAGKMYYDAGQTKYYYCNGSSWTQIGSGGGDSWWTSTNGLLYPVNASLDLAIGGTTTASAAFAFINVASGNPAFRVYSPARTNYVNITNDGTNGTITSTNGLVVGSGGGDLLIGEAGTAVNLKFDETAQIYAATGKYFDIGTGGRNATFSGTLSLGPQVQTYAGTCNATAAGKMYYDASQSQYYFCNGSAWGAVGGGTNYWQLASGALSPINITNDLLVGGTSTASAKFAFINNWGSTPVASVAGNLVLGSAAGTTRTFGATNMNPLQIGTSTTGDIQFYSSSNKITSAGALTLASTITANTTDTINGLSINAASITDAVNLNMTGYATSSGGLAVGYSSMLAGPNAVVAGRVGIGTSSPAYSLEVAGGNAYFQEVTYLGTTSTYFDTLGNLNVAGYSTASSSLAIGYSSVLAGVGNGVFAGFVGIGTSNPTTNLDIRGNATLSGTLVLAPQTQAYAGTCNATTNAGKLYYDGAAGKYYYCNGSAWTEMGSGATGTNYWTLGSGLIYPTLTSADVAIGGTSTSGANFAFINNLTGTPTATFSGNLFLAANGVNYRTFSTTNNASLAINPTGGNVGIGTTSPSNLLSVSKTQDSDTIVSVSNASNTASATTQFLAQSATSTIKMLALPSNFVLTNFADRGLIYADVDAAGLDLVAAATTGDIRFYAGGNASTNEFMRINSLGNVGIGTTAPAGNLHVVAGGGNGALVLNQTSSGNLISASQSGTLKFYVTNNGSINTSGYATVSGSLALGYSSVLAGAGNGVFSGWVGIGTSAPTTNLDVRGNSSISGTLTLAPQTQAYAGACNAGSKGEMYYDNGQSKYYFCNGSAWTEMGSGATGTSYWTYGSGLIYPTFTSADVAIGGTSTSAANFAFINNLTGTPTATFSGNLVLASLAGTTRTLGATNMNPLQIGTSTTGDLQFYSASNKLTSAGALTIASTITANTTNTINSLSINAGSLTNAVNINMTGYATASGGLAVGYSSLQAGPNAVIAGRVGIGTSNPSQALDVSGNATIGGNLVLSSTAGTTRTVGSTNMNPLQIGTSTTGDLQFYSSSNKLTSAGALTIASTITANTTDTINGLSINAASITDLVNLNMTGYATGSSSLAIGYSSVLAGVGNAVFSGWVGIGTSNPTTNLDIRGNSSISGTLTLAPQTQAYAGTCNAGSKGEMYYDNAQSQYYFCNGSSWGAMGGSGTNYWQLAAGALSPLNISNDLLIGGTATASAKFAMLNNWASYPMLKIFDNDSSMSLNLSTNGTNALIAASSGNVEIGSGGGDFLIGEAGTAVNIKFDETAQIYAATGKYFDIGTGGRNATFSGTLSLGPQTQAYAGTCNATTNVGKMYFDASQSKYYYCPGAAGWTQIGSGSSSTSYWTLGSGLIYPTISTADVAIGGTSTSGANFAFINNLTGTPTATFSGNLVLGSAAGTTRTIGGTNMNPLQIGTSTTGDTQFYSSSNKITSAGALTLASTVTANSTDTINGLSINAASITDLVNLNMTGYATSSSSLAVGYSSMLAGKGNAVFAGSVGIGTSNPAYKLEVAGGNVYFQDTTYLGTTSTFFDTLGNLNLGGYATVSGGLSLGYSSMLAGVGNAVFSGFVGIGTTAPAAKLHVTGSTGSRALAIIDQTGTGDILTASASGVTKFTIDRLGNATASGTLTSLNSYSSISNTSGDITLNAASNNISFAGDYITNLGGITGDLRINNTGNYSQILNNSGTATILMSTAPTTRNNTLNSGSWLIENSASGNVGQAALMVNQAKTGLDIFTASAAGLPKFTIGYTGNVGIGTQSASAKTEIYGSGNLLKLTKTDGYYRETTSTNTFSLSGTGQNWKADDGSWAYTLPFSFPFYGTNVTKVTISSNGVIFMCDACGTLDGYPVKTTKIANYPAIVPLWGDWKTNGSGQTNEDIYIDSTVAGQVTIRWRGEVYGSATDVLNFSATLYSDGRITFHYGSGNTNLQRNDANNGTVAVSRGNGKQYQLLSNNIASNQTNALDYLLNPTPQHSLWVYDPTAGDYFSVTGGGDTYVGGYLGIGTSSPSSALTMAGGTFLQKATTTPTIVNYLKDSNKFGSAHGIQVVGQYAYVAASNNNSLTIVDISNPAEATSIAQLRDNDRLQYPYALQVAGKYAYIVTSSSAYGLTIVDVSNPYEPFVIGRIQDLTLLYNPTDIYVSGNYAYITAYSDNRVTIVDVSNPTSPRIVGSLKDGTKLFRPSEIYVSGKYAYIASYQGNSLTVVDISNPASPTITGWLQDNTKLNGAASVDVSGRYAYVATSVNYFTVVDISNPASPTITGWITDTSQLAATWSVSVAGNYAYVADYSGTGLTVIDISSPTAPKIVSRLTDSTRLYDAWQVAVAGKYAYVTTEGNNALTIIDISGINAPAANIGSLFTNDLMVTENANIANNLYVSNGLNVGMGGIYANGSLTLNGLTTSTTSATLDVKNSTGSSLLYVRNDGNVGIGTTSPVHTLDLVGREKIYAVTNTANEVTRGLKIHDSYIVHDGQQTSHNGLVFANIDYSPYSFRFGKYPIGDVILKDNLSNFTDQMVLTNGGNVGIGTTGPADGLAVSKDNNGNYSASFFNTPSDVNALGIKIRAGNNTSGTLATFQRNDATAVGSITFSGGNTTAYNTTSDRRLKENLISTTTGLDALMKISVNDFNFISDPDKTQVQGFIAQDLYNIYPEAVHVGGAEPTKDPWAIDYGRLTPLLVASIQEQQGEIASLSGALNNLSLTQNGDLKLADMGNYLEVRDSGGNLITKLINFANVGIANLQTGLANVQQLVADNVTVNNKLVSPLVETHQLTADSVQSTESKFGKIIVDGDATFSGTVNINESTINHLTINHDATVGGTLYADEIVTRYGKFGDLLANQVYTESIRSATVAAQYITYINNYLSVQGTGSSVQATGSSVQLSGSSVQATGSSVQSPVSPVSTASAFPSPSPVDVPISTMSALTSDTSTWLTNNVSQDLTISGQQITITNDLKVLGRTSLADTSIAGMLTVDGAVTIDSLGISSLPATTLYLQPNSWGNVDILAGKVVIDVDGNVQIAGNLAVAGELSASKIAINSQGFGDILEIKDASGSALATVDASGSARFASLKVNADYTATEAGAIIAAPQNWFNGGSYSPALKTNAAAGVGVLPAGETEIQIYNAKVSNQSMIYLAPTSSTENQVLYLKAKHSSGPENTDNTDRGWFSVAIDQPISQDITFNWWIIN